MGKFFLGIIGFLTLLVSGFLIGFLLTYVIIDVSKLYQLSFITCFPFAQIYCVMFIIGMVIDYYKPTTNDKDNKNEGKTFTDIILNGFGLQVGKCIGILFAWWVITLIHNIL
jgi:hypothetical protein